MRNYDQNQKSRQTAISTDGGITWTDQKYDKALIEPICQASLQSIQYEGKHALIFSNPASQGSRSKMTVRLGTDESKTCIHDYTITDNPSAYSDLVEIGIGEFACLFKTGDESPYERIVYASLSLKADKQ